MHNAVPVSSPAASRRLVPGRGCAALLGALVVLVCVLPGASARAEEPRLVSHTLSVLNPSGRAANLLRRLTLPQLAAALHTTPAELVARIQTQLGHLGVRVELGELTLNPSASVAELIDALVARGATTQQVEQAIYDLLAPYAESAEKLRSLVETLLADTAENGKLGVVAKELGVPVSALEGAHFVPATLEQVAGALETVSTLLSSLLSSSGSTGQSATSTAPLTVNQIEGGAGGTTFIVGAAGAPGASGGGVTLTTIHSTSTASSPPGVLGATTSAPSSAFSILSISVSKSGVILEKVSLPGPGRVAVNASITRKVAKKARRGKRFVRRTATVASSSLETVGGIRTIALQLAAGVLRARPVAVTLATTYTPTGGTSNTIRRTVTVRPSRTNKHQKHR